jgi:putative DNA primase/helicase
MPLDFIEVDLLEKQLKDRLDSCQVGTDEHQFLELMLFNMQSNNRGIKETKNGYSMDGNIYAKYVNNIRLKAVMVNDILKLYNFKEGMHQLVPETFLNKCLKEILEECSAKVWSISNQNTYLKAFTLSLNHLIRVPINPDRLLLDNGILDINEFCSGKADALHPFSPSEFHTVKIPHKYDPNAKCELFQRTVADIFNHDHEVIQSFQEMLGYLLYYGGTWKIQKFFVFYGKGSNGKSLLCSIIRKLLGENNCSSTALDRLHETFALQDLYGKMVNISPEAEQKKFMDTATIKSLSGGDAIKYEFKYKAPFTDVNYTKIIVCTNFPIKTSDTSIGFFRRLHVFPFDNHYKELKEGEKPKANVKYMDTSLEEKLIKELPGILNFALEGLKRLKNNDWKMSECKRIKEIQDKYYNDANEIEVFTDQCLSIRVGSRSKSSEVYDKYVDWSLKVLKRNVTFNRNEFHKRFREYLDKEEITWSKSEIHGIDYYNGFFIN